MKKALIIRHVSYSDLLTKLVLLPKDLVIDVISSTDIPSIGFNSVIKYDYDIVFNINKTPQAFIDNLNSYDVIYIFQNTEESIIPINIIEFVKGIIKIASVGIIQNEGIVYYDVFNFDKFINDLKLKVSLPKRLSISICDICNLKCEFCYRKNETEYKIMNFSDIKKIPIELFQHAEEIELSGYGEVLINKDIDKIIEELSLYTNIKKINFTTNATLLTPDLIDRLLEYPKLNLIQISLDTINKRLYEKIRNKAKFRPTINNIKYLLKNKHKNPKLMVFIKTVITTDTLLKLKQLIKFSKKYNVDRLIGLNMNISKESMIEKSVYFNKIKTNKLYTEFEKYAKKLNVSLTLPPKFDEKYKILYNENQIRDYKNHPCYEPYEVMYIQANGDVYPCCFSTTSYGNIFTESLEDIWYGKKYKGLRKNVNTIHCPKDCKKCGMTENIDNLYFTIKKGDEFREKNIMDYFKKYKGEN